MDNYLLLCLNDVLLILKTHLQINHAFSCYFNYKKLQIHVFIIIIRLLVVPAFVCGNVVSVN